MAYVVPIVTWIMATAIGVVGTLPAEAGLCGGRESFTCEDGTPCTTAADCPGGVNCVSDCIVGGRQANSECLLNLAGIRLNHPSDGGPGAPKAKKEVRCVDGDPCDRDGVVNGTCTFDVTTCLRNDDPAFPGCDAALGLKELVVKSGRGRRYDPELVNLATRGRLILESAPGNCSEPGFLQVPLQPNRTCSKISRAKKKIDMVVVSVPDSAGRVRKDRDKVTLTCLPAPDAVCGSVQGRVVRVDGMPVSGARVSIGGRSAETDAAGRFALRSGQTGLSPLTVSKAGFLDSVQVIDVREVTPGFDIVLLAEGSTIRFFPSRAETAEILGNRVSFRRNAFVREDGKPIDEQIVVGVRPLDPSSAEGIAFPGGFLGIDRANGQSVVLESVALMNVTARTDSGARLQLAPNRPMDLEVTIPRLERNPVTQLPYAAGDQLPLWWLNPSTGIWESEGVWTAMTCTWNPDAFCLSAQVHHMSWVNVDVPWDKGPPILGVNPSDEVFPNVACLTGRVVDPSGVAFDDAEVAARGLDYAGTTRQYTDGDGTFCVHVMRDSEIALDVKRWASDGIVDQTYQGPLKTSLSAGTCNDVGSCQAMPDVIIESPRTCVRGTVVDANGTLVAKAEVGTNQGATETSDRDGRYCVAVRGELGDEVGVNASRGRLSGEITGAILNSNASCEQHETCTDLLPLVMEATMAPQIPDGGSIVILPNLHVGLGNDPIITLALHPHEWYGSSASGRAICFYATRSGCVVDSFDLDFASSREISWLPGAGRTSPFVPSVPVSPFIGDLVCVGMDGGYFPVSANRLELKAAYSADCSFGGVPCPETNIAIKGFDTNNADHVLCLGGNVSVSCPMGMEYEACPPGIPVSQIEGCWSDAEVYRTGFEFRCN